METNQQLKQLRAALTAAIWECTEHNNEYHHTTRPELLAEWLALTEKAGAALESARLPPDPQGGEEEQAPPPKGKKR